MIIPPDSRWRRPSRAPPPTPGEIQQQAIDTLFGGPSPRSNGETSMLDAAGRDEAQLGIRSTVGDPGTRLVDKGATTRADSVGAAGEQQHRLRPGGTMRHLGGRSFRNG